MATTSTDFSGIVRSEETWSVSRLIPDEKNAKKHEPKQVAKIAESIRQNGWITRIVVEEDGTIIAGHGRRLAAISIDPKGEVPVLVLKGITKEQARALRLIDNKVQEGGYDTGLLSEELRELVLDLDFDMSKFFDERDLNFAIDDLGEIDLGALSDDISAEVIEQTERTATEIEQSDKSSVPVGKVLGFASFTSEQARLVKKFVAIIEAETGLQGAEALTVFAGQFAGGEA
jgi:hypothetical protein